MREVIECLIAWLDSVPSDDKPHRIMSALAKESLKKADFGEEQRRFTAVELAEAAGENRDNSRKWLDWNRTVIPYWESRKSEVIEFFRRRGLESYPKPEHLSNLGGRGKEATYFIVAEPLPVNVDESQNSQSFKEEPSRISKIHYDKTLPGEVKPLLMAKWLFSNGQIQMSMMKIWLIIGFLFLLGFISVGFSYISFIVLSVPKPVTTQDLTTIISIFVIPASVWLFFIRPWVRLFDDRIVQAPDLLVALSEKQAQIELYKEGDLRFIRLVRYSAPCPACGATIYLDDGKPDFPRRLVGRCSESPREHIFSFDWVTKRGAILRISPPP